MVDSFRKLFNSLFTTKVTKEHEESCHQQMKQMLQIYFSMSFGLSANISVTSVLSVEKYRLAGVPALFVVLRDLRGE